jgi:putative tryptophan/tyrosine transport system substrate-binding protein
MRRREVIAVIAGAAAAWPLGARAQQPGKVRKIGFLYPGPVAASHARIDAILVGLREGGYRESRQVELVSRIADGDSAKLSTLAAELIQEEVDVIIAVSTAAIRIAQATTAATTPIPIIGHDLETDPVTSGLIESYARPGGQITGVFFDFPEIRSKWLELLQEAIPGLASVAMLWDPASGPAQKKAAESAANRLNLRVEIFEVRTTTELGHAFLAAAREDVGAVLVLSSPFFGTHPNLLADLALRHRLPTITLFPDFARAGGLMAFGPNLLDTYRTAGSMAGKLLRNVKPSDLAIERPSRFELIVNVRTAKAIGVTIPTSILLRADEVIE